MTTLIYCADGNKRFAELAIKYGFKYGAQLPNTVHFSPYFTDQNWKNPDREKYMAAIRQHKPAIATVLDLENPKQFEEVLSWASEASQYVSEAVIIIPKYSGAVSALPDFVSGKQVRLGFSVPTKFGATSVPLWEFGQRPVHLLGGSPKKQIELSRYLNAVSADGNYINKIAVSRSQFFAAGHAARFAANASFPQLMETIYGRVAQDAPYFAFELSLMNFKAAWAGSPAFVRFAVESDIPQVKAIANKYKNELGFVNSAALRESIAKRSLYVSQIGDFIVGFANCRHRRDGVTVVYEIAVAKHMRRSGVARGLLASLPAAPVRLKCTVDNPANKFYEAVGFAHLGIEDGRKRALNVWQRV